MTDYSELKRLAEAFPADLDWDGNSEPFFNGPSGESLGGGPTGFYCVFGQPFEIDGDTYDGHEYVSACKKQFAEFLCSARSGVLELISEVERLTAILSRPENMNAKPAKDYEALKKQFGALKTYAACQEKMREYYRDAAENLSKLDRSQSAEEIGAQRSVNEQLTNDLLRTEAERDQLKAEVEALRATADLKKLLPDVSDALEQLELHGRHSDQGYRKLQDWYRKVAAAYLVINAPMFGADHADLVSQNTWLRKMVGHQAEQHAPMEPIADPEGWSRRLPGYDLPALLRDAERYRYLRNGAYSFENSRREVVAIEDLDAPKDQFPSGAEMLDAAVDLAMSKESGQ